MALQWSMFFLSVYVASASAMYRLSEKENEELMNTCGMAPTPATPKHLFFRPVKAEHSDHPWAVAIYILNYETGTFESCTGTLISRWHIVTSAHCFPRKFWENRNMNLGQRVFVFGGSPCADCEDSSSSKGLLLQVKSIEAPLGAKTYLQPEEPKEIPPEAADFAIVELKEPIPASLSNLRPICVDHPSRFHHHVPASLTVYGFGRRNIFGRRMQDRGKLTSFVVKNPKVHCKDSDYENISPEYRFGCLPWFSAKVAVSERKHLICESNSGGGVTAMKYGRRVLFGVNPGGLGLCHGFTKNPQVEQLFDSVAYQHNFMCNEAGICPLGYNQCFGIPEKHFYLSRFEFQKPKCVSAVLQSRFD